jgi:hypothetical protein
MAYNTKQIEQQALEAIAANNLMFVGDILAYVGCSRATFYNKGLDKVDAIKDALEKNRIKTKNGLRAKWYNSDNPTVQIALYKLIGSDEEVERLNGSRQHVDHTTGGNPIQPQITINQIGALPQPVTSEDDIDENI